jgi:ParB family chromosome partitioning protein
MSKRPRGLGAGFASLLGDKINLSPDSDHDDALIQLSLSALIAGRFQPRTQWDDAALTELANSIQAQGVVQPIVVRPLAGGLYEIITGERRWRASKLAGLTSIPAVVRQLDDQSALAIALIENIQREDLSAIEEARAILNLTDTFELTHEQVAQLLGRSREAVSNLLRLLKLAPSVQESVLDGQLSAGHARALIALEEPQQQQLAQLTISHQWSVRELETAVRQLQQSENLSGDEMPAKQTLDPEFEHWRDALSSKLGVNVRLTVNAKGKGKLEIPFMSTEALKLLIDKL